MGASPATLSAARRTHILAELAQQGSVRAADLTRDLKVSPLTIRRDLEQMEEEGLLDRVRGGAMSRETPSPAASPLDRTFGVLVPSVLYYWPTVVQGMEARATASSTRIVLTGSSYGASDERPFLESLLNSTPVAGLILAPRADGPHSGDLLAWLAENKLPFVLVEREATLDHAGHLAESVTSDRALGVRLAVRHLMDLGHHKLGLVLSQLSPLSSRLQAEWDHAQQEMGFSGPVWPISESRADGFPDVVDQILDNISEQAVSAILVHSDPEALAIVQHAQARGLSVPEDLSVISYDDEVASLYSPGLTAIRSPKAAIGATAVDLLNARLDDPSRPVHRVILSPDLIIRESTTSPKAI